MSVLSWLGGKLGLVNSNWAFMREDSFSGKTVNAESAMTVAAYWAAVRLVSQTIATLPLALYQRNKNGGRDVASSDLYRILHTQPNADQTAVEFWEGMAASVCIWGNAYAEKQQNGNGKLLGLKPLTNPQTSVTRNKAGALEYRYSDQGKSRTLTEDRVFHIRGFGIGGDLGLSPLSFARQTLGSAMATDEAAARIFANGMRPQGFFVVDKLLSQEQRDQAKKVMIDPMSGASNTGKVGILEAGFRWQDVQMPAEDAQLLQSRAFNVEEVCRWLGVPPILVGHASAGQTMWGSGVEQIMIGWLTLGLRPYLARIEQAINRSLLTAKERDTMYAEYVVEGLLRADSKSRAEFYSTLAQNGIMTRNEIREKENLPRMAGGDVLTVQSNLTPINKLGANTQGEGNVVPFPRPAAEGGR